MDGNRIDVSGREGARQEKPESYQSAVLKRILPGRVGRETQRSDLVRYYFHFRVSSFGELTFCMTLRWEDKGFYDFNGHHATATLCQDAYLFAYICMCRCSCKF